MTDAMGLLDSVVLSVKNVFADQDSVVYLVLALVLVTVVAFCVVSKLLTRLIRKADNTSNYWDDVFLYALKKPICFLIVISGAHWIAYIIIKQHTRQDGLSVISLSYFITLTLLLCWFTMRLIRRAADHFIHHPKSSGVYDITTVHITAKLLRLTCLVITGLVILQTLGVNLSGVLAFGGISGIAVGFAAKDLLANFFGGLMIYLDKPFKVGDWIRSPDKSIEGTVEEVGWRQTRIRTFDKRPLYVPNAIFSTIAIENPSRMFNRRIYETMGLRYQDADKVNAILGDVDRYLREHDAIDSDNNLLMVHFNTVSASSLDFFVYCFTKTTQWAQFHVVKQEILLGILAIIHKQGADISFPTTTLDIPHLQKNL